MLLSCFQKRRCTLKKALDIFRSGPDHQCIKDVMGARRICSLCPRKCTIRPGTLSFKSPPLHEPNQSPPREYQFNDSQGRTSSTILFHVTAMLWHHTGEPIIALHNAFIKVAYRLPWQRESHLKTPNLLFSNAATLKTKPVTPIFLLMESG